MNIGFTLLGDVTIRSRGADVAPGSPRQRCVLALLLIDANRPVSAQTLLTRVWGDDVPPRAMASLYSYVSRLRALRSDPGDAERWDIVRTPAGYVLRTDNSAVDLFRFRSLVEQARGANDPRQAEASYGRALALWQGEPLAGLRSPWLDAYRLTLAEEHQRARLDYYELLLNRGRHVDLVQPLAALAAEQPLDEQVAHLHMLALYRTGQPAAALTAYEQLRKRLVERLGTDPGPRLQELHQRILVFDDALAAPAAEAPEPRTPRQLPASPSGFVGRDDALRLLDAREGRADDTAPDVFVIAGMAGVGKSWLALRWAHQHADAFPDGQLYAQLNGFRPCPPHRPLSPAPAPEAMHADAGDHDAARQAWATALGLYRPGPGGGSTRGDRAVGGTDRARGDGPAADRDDRPPGRRHPGPHPHRRALPHPPAARTAEQGQGHQTPVGHRAHQQYSRWSEARAR
ncbi:BTAD domain-containing putative transcriptional regulator [Streptomyces canarius]